MKKDTSYYMKITVFCKGDHSTIQLNEEKTKDHIQSNNLMKN